MITKKPITEKMIREASITPSEESRTSPRALFKTPYTLTRDQEDVLIKTIMDGFGRLRTEMEEAPKNQVGSVKESFVKRRRRMRNYFDNDVKERVLRGGLWKVSNLCLNLSHIHVLKMIAKAIGYFFGTDPWLAVDPEGAEDRESADKIEKFTRWKIGKTPCKRAMMDSIWDAFISGEGIVKTIYREDFDKYKTFKSVMIDGDGNPVLTSDGDYIFEDDVWVDSPEAVESAKGQAEAQGILPKIGKAWNDFKTSLFGPAGIPQVLKKDPSFPKPAESTWKEMMVDRSLPLFQGPESTSVPIENFFCPLEAPSVEEAEMVCHIYDKPLHWLTLKLNQYNPDDDNLSAKERALMEENALNLLRENLKSDGDNSNTAGDNSSGEGTQADRPIPAGVNGIRFLEAHLEGDFNEDGYPDRITVVMDRENKLPIYYNYTANVFLTGKRPFQINRCMEVKNRWWGISMMEVLESMQEFIDKCYNRIEARNGEAGRFTVWNPHLTVEGQEDPNLKLNHGQTYTAKNADVKIADIIQYIQLPPMNEQTYKMLELTIQVFQQTTGTVTADANAISGLDQTKLATGLRNLERSQNEHFGLFLQALEPGMTSILKANVDIIFARMNKKEVFNYTNGKDLELLEITPEEVVGMDVNVKLTLTRQKSEERLAQAMQGVEIVDRFYALPPPIQEASKPVYEQALKALEFSNVDQLLSVIPIQPMGAPVLGLPAPQMSPQPAESAALTAVPGQEAVDPATQQPVPVLV